MNDMKKIETNNYLKPINVRHFYLIKLFLSAPNACILLLFFVKFDLNTCKNLKSFA